MPTLDKDTVAKIQSVRIHPPIGIARVGNSKEDNGWFYGPEIPGRIDVPEGGFKDELGAVKRQAARFRLYGFADDGSVVCELNKSNGFDLKWTFEVANQKAAWYAFQGKDDAPVAWQPGNSVLRNPTIQNNLPPERRSDLIIRSGNTLTGANAKPVALEGPFTGSSGKTHTIHLGEAWTDEEGHLVVLAGYGDSRSVLDDNDPYPLIMNDFDSPDWVDDTSDGSIAVKAKYSGGSTVQIFTPDHSARVIGTTPKFSTEIYAPTSLYDLMEDIYEAEARKDPNYLDNLNVEWYQDIWPLLQRPSLLSWVNGQANNGHGLLGPGDFFDPKWQATLKDPSDASKSIRQGVLGRMRLPVNTNLTQARAGQAYPYFMPWLSGDLGRATPGIPETFTSVTQLQYDRLTKWANGEFSVGNPLPVYASFGDIPLDLQPAALTRASLEPTIGSPLYPGIEMSWNAELPETYELDSRFTIADKLQPGDLTKYLSLPWQSDFYMCRSYWWPSARPDAVVRDVDYDSWQNSEEFKLWEKLRILRRPGPVPQPPPPKRVPWERGLRLNHTDVYSDQPLFANTDMVQFWHQLGFVVQVSPPPPLAGGIPFFVETERGDIHVHSTVKPPGPHPPPWHLPPLKGPNHPIKTVESLQQHLQVAMAVELSTIPLYLFAQYTVKVPKEYANDPRYVDPVISAVKGVVTEEMLHLSLAGNILKAVRGVPKLYARGLVPSYPSPMLHRVPPLMLRLREMTKRNLDTFIAVEKPEASGAVAQADYYQTLGQFYQAIKDGLEFLNKTHPKTLFDSNSKPYQFAPGVGYQARIRDAGGSVVVSDIVTARAAVNTIVDQGEGNPGPYDDADFLEKDHYAIFQELQQSPEYQWETYPVFVDPQTYKYYALSKQIYQVSRTFDAAYCFLLLTIEKLWTIEDNDSRKQLVLGNMFTIMLGVLGPLAQFLIQQPIGNEGKVACPCFNYYEFDERSALSQLLEEMQTSLDVYLDTTTETQDQVAVVDYGKQIENLLSIQSTMSTLIDLDQYTALATPLPKKTQLGTSNNRGAKGFGPVVL